MFLMSERQVQRLANEGILRLATDTAGKSIRGRYILGDAVAGYVKHLRESVADNPEAKLYQSARTRRMDALAQKEELDLKLRKGQLHHADDVAFVMTNMMTFFRQRVLAIPSRTARLLVGKTNFREVHDLIKGEIYGCLNELSGYDAKAFDQQAAARLAKHLAKRGVDETP